MSLHDQGKYFLILLKSWIRYIFEHAIAESIQELFEESACIDVSCTEFFEYIDDSYTLRFSQRLDNIIDECIFYEREGISYMIKTNLVFDSILLEERECISESSSGNSGDEF